MSGCNLDMLLQSLCKPGDAAWITQKPWLVTLGEQTYAAATDGPRALYLATDGANAIPGAEHLRNKYEPCDLPHMANLLAKVPAPTHQVDRSALLAAIGPGGVVFWELAQCPWCGGRGCWHCSQEGEVCQRSDSERIDPIVIEGMRDPIDAQLARGIFEQLPGDSIALSAIPGMVVFQGPGWVLLIAPLSVGNAPPARYVDAARIQPAEPSA